MGGKGGFIVFEFEVGKLEYLLCSGLSYTILSIYLKLIDNQLKEQLD